MMPKNRVQVGPLPGPAPLTPRATPVDTFHRPDEIPRAQGPSQLDQLAAALKDLSPSLFAAADIQHAEQTNKELSEGEQAILADKRLQNRKALREAVARGELPAARNPWFLQGMRQQVYRIEAEKYDQALREAYARSDSRNEDDISDFVGGFTEKYMEGVGADPGDPEVARIFTPSVERSQSNLLSHHRTARDQAILLQVEQNTDTEIGLLLDNMEQSGGSPEFYAKTIHGLVQDQYLNGLDGTRSNQIMAGAIARKALLTLDSSYLDLLDQIPAGRDGKNTLGQIGFVKDLRRETEESIFRGLDERDRINAEKAKEEREAAIDAGQRSIFQKINTDPGADVSQELQQLAEVDPKAAQEAYGWRQAHINGADNIVEDQDTVVEMTAEVFGGNGSLAKVMEAQRKGKISKQTATKLAENLERAKEFRSTLRDSTVQELHRALGQTIRGNDLDFKESNAINATRAQNEFLNYLMSYKKSHPEATEGDVLKYAVEMQKTLLGVYAGEALEGAKVKVDQNSAFIVDPAAVDWQRDLIFEGDSMNKAVMEYNESRGTSGAIKRLADRLGIEPKKLYLAQLALSRKPKSEPNK